MQIITINKMDHCCYDDKKQQKKQLTYSMDSSPEKTYPNKINNDCHQNTTHNNNTSHCCYQTNYSNYMSTHQISHKNNKDMFYISDSFNHVDPKDNSNTYYHNRPIEQHQSSLNDIPQKESYYQQKELNEHYPTQQNQYQHNINHHQQKHQPLQLQAQKSGNYPIIQSNNDYTQSSLNLNDSNQYHTLQSMKYFKTDSNISNTSHRHHITSLHKNKKKETSKPISSLTKAIPVSNNISSAFPLSHLTTKKLTEQRLKQVSESFSSKNPNKSMIPMNSRYSQNLKKAPHIGIPPIPKNNEEDDNKTANLKDNDIEKIKNDLFQKYLLEENAKLKESNEIYKQMLDSTFYFINALSYAHNTQKEYDVNYYTSHVSELNNALLDLEKSLKNTISDSYQIILRDKERIVKEAFEGEEAIKREEEAKIKAHEDYFASLQIISEIDFSLLPSAKEPIFKVINEINDMNVYQSFGNDELLYKPKDNCVACLVGANNTTRGYSPMKYNPNHYKEQTINTKTRNNQKARSVTPKTR